MIKRNLHAKNTLTLGILFVWLCLGLNLYSQKNPGTIVSFSHIYQNSDFSFSGGAGAPVAAYYPSSTIPVQIGLSSLLVQENTRFENAICTINGLVHTGDSLLDYGLIYIIDSANYSMIDSFVINRGKFALGPLPTGSYHLLAEPRGKAAYYYESAFYVNKKTIEESKAIKIRETVWEIGGLDLRLIPKQDEKSALDLKIEFMLFPNPVKDVIRIRFVNTLSDKIEISLTSLDGKKVLSRDINPKHGLNEVYIDTGNLGAGIYILTLCASAHVPNSKMVVKN